MRITTLVILLPLILLPTRGLQGQVPKLNWKLKLSGAISAFSLDLRGEPAWRTALSARLRPIVGDHFHFEAAVALPTSSREALICPSDASSQCVSDYGEKEFSMLTGAVGVHTEIGRITPYLGAGGGRIKVDGDSRATWLLYSGMEVRILEALGLFLEYRASRVNWRYQGVGYNQEWSVGFSVDLLPLPR